MTGERAYDVSGDEIRAEGQLLHTRLRATFESPDYRPPTLPKVALDLLALSRRPEVDAKDIVALLERDQMLAGRVLRLARSAAYTGSGDVRSLREAVVRLGVRTLRDVVFEASVQTRVFHAKAYQGVMAQVAWHSTVTAHLCRTVARYTSVDAEYAFLCGLLHDAGIAGLLIALADAPGPHPRIEVAWPAIERLHEDASTILGRLWELPPEIVLVMGHHHQFVIDKVFHPMIGILGIAEEVAASLGAGVVIHDRSGLELPADVNHRQDVDRAREALGVSQRTMDAIHRDAAALAGRLGSHLPA